MSVVNPDHLFEQADRLVVPSSSGAPRQVDLRRAISSAYYGVFHFILAVTADEFIGIKHRTAARYALVYRSIDHTTLRRLCEEVRKQAPAQKYAPYVPSGGFGSGIQAFAIAAVDLQDKRHRADYNPQATFRTLDAKLAIGAARSAIQQFGHASATHRKAFLTLLLCPPR